MHEKSPPLSVTENENIGTTTENGVGAEDQLLSVESIIGSPNVEFAGDLTPEATSYSGGINGGADSNNYVYEEGCLASVLSGYYPAMDASILSPLLIDEAAQPAAPMTVNAGEYSPMEAADVLSPLQALQQSGGVMQSYDGNDQRLYLQGGAGGGGIMPMELMAEMQYNNMAASVYDLQNVTLHQHLYASNHSHPHQLLMDTQVENQQNNSSLVAVCSGGGSSSNIPSVLFPDMSGLDEPTFKIGCLTPEQKKEKIHRFMRKRNERNFTKKIKYACRKTLADSRPRIRGRFAKNEELGEGTGIHMGSHDYEEGDEVRDEESYDSSDILAHITGVNSFKHSGSTEPWTI